MSNSKKLEEYKKKRNFDKTPEPGDTSADENDHPIFVVQKHDASSLHYDFRLEIDNVLVSWAVPKGPSMKPNQKRLAIQTEDHPLGYADFEGRIPEGEYGAGSVIIWDKGIYKNTRKVDLKNSLEEGKIEFKLEGEKLMGSFALIRTGNPEKKSTNWLLIKKNDEFAVKNEDDPEITQEKPKSVVSGKTVTEI